MMDAFFPPISPSGRRLRRIDLRSFEEGLLLVAAGEMVHPTIASFLNYYVHDGVVAVPISDLPPSETALVWMTAKHSAKIDAFAHAAADVLAANGRGTTSRRRATARSPSMSTARGSERRSALGDRGAAPPAADPPIVAPEVVGEAVDRAAGRRRRDSAKSPHGSKSCAKCDEIAYFI